MNKMCLSAIIRRTSLAPFAATCLIGMELLATKYLYTDTKDKRMSEKQSNKPKHLESQKTNKQTKKVIFQ